MSCGAAADVRVNAAQPPDVGKAYGFRRGHFTLPFVLIHRLRARRVRRASAGRAR